MSEPSNVLTPEPKASRTEQAERRREALRVNIEQLEEIQRSGTDLKTALEGTELDRWELEQLGYALSGAATPWGELIKEGVAFRNKCQTDVGWGPDLQRLSPSELNDYRRVLIIDASVGIALLEETQRALNTLIRSGEMDVVKKFTAFRNKISASVNQLKASIGEAGLERATTASEQLIAPEGMASWTERETPEVAPEPTPIRNPPTRPVVFKDSTPAAAPSHVKPLLMLLGLAVVVWGVFILPKLSVKTVPVLTTADIAPKSEIRFIDAKPPSLYVELDAQAWRQLTKEDRIALMDDVGKTASAAGYNGAHFRLEDGRTAGMWLKEKGSKLQEELPAERRTSRPRATARGFRYSDACSETDGRKPMSERYEALRRHLRELAALNSALGLLSWDQETMMPARAAAARADELSLLSRLAHERAIATELGEMLSACETDTELQTDAAVTANLREIRHDYDRARKLPTEFVAEFSQTTSQALQAWKTARSDSDFPTFRPWLEKLLGLSRRKAEYFGVPEGGELYDALLDEFEPGMTAAVVESTFGPLREELVPLIDAIRGKPEPDDGPAKVEVPIETQKSFNREILKLIGFDLEAGRLDVSTHPFSSGIAPGDTRITSRYKPTGFAEALSSTMHEAGHGMYEQGLPKSEHWGEPMSEPLGLGIHESQSRMWENQVGRSREFWTWLRPRLAAATDDAFAAYDAEALYRAANIVRPKPIRVESDEATYNLHVMLRFDLERAMFRGDLAVADLPGAWDERVKKDLGLDVPDAARGCLQDIHWAMGAIGYFPTYTLGTLYAAQFWDAILVDLPDLPERIGRGEFAELLGWLRVKIHRRGRQLPAEALCIELTGRPLDHRPFMDYLKTKLGGIYGLEG